MDPCIIQLNRGKKWFLQAIHDAATAAVKSFNMIHCGRLWLTRVESRALIEDIQLFCAAYSALARRSYEQKLCRFPIQPVLHAWQHNAVRMESVLARGSPFVLNPYAHMNDRNEDFLGHVSRISRRSFWQDYKSTNTPEILNSF